ncbi:hypothetical protein [Metabacillus fastidiosus]|uniref:hypothetical protein n=1 Tax=Metabacillus fastidiosus TaxID=1458 RepID=UPI002DB7167C|nr:hypothetical protein [Metabacillus fastidiosus]MEC2075918.1 hypothetical protein [Metabacillus fastidiosus]
MLVKKSDTSLKMLQIRLMIFLLLISIFVCYFIYKIPDYRYNSVLNNFRSTVNEELKEKYPDLLISTTISDTLHVELKKEFNELTIKERFKIAEGIFTEYNHLYKKQSGALGQGNTLSIYAGRTVIKSDSTDYFISFSGMKVNKNGGVSWYDKQGNLTTTAEEKEHQEENKN